jgi:nicotinamidase/pyrazinamidase
MAGRGIVTTYRETIFWDVDTQMDFMLPDGKLYAPGAEQIIPRLLQLTQYARERRILVVATVDAHHLDDAEFAQWPPHCLVDTPGQQKIPQTQLPITCVVPNVIAEIPSEPGCFEQIILEKQTVDDFTNPNVDKLLARLGKPEVMVYGVVTEVCVFFAAKGLLQRNYPVRLVTDAIWPFQPEAGNRSLAELQRLGAQLVTTEEVLRRHNLSRAQ